MNQAIFLFGLLGGPADGLPSNSLRTGSRISVHTAEFGRLKGDVEISTSGWLHELACRLLPQVTHGREKPTVGRLVCKLLGGLVRRTGARTIRDAIVIRCQ